MKKLFLTLALAALALTAPAAFGQSNIAVTRGKRTSDAPLGASKSYFEGDRITGVGASSSFDVVLVRSDRTRAVVEFVPGLEPFLDVKRDAAGVVTVGLKGEGMRNSREINRLTSNGHHPRLTLYLPVLNTVRLSGATSLRTSDPFTGTDLDILLSGASDIDGELRVESARAKVQCSGSSDIDGSLSLPTTRELTLVISGASDANIHAPALEYVKLGLSGSSDLTLSGAARHAQWNVSGGSELGAGAMKVVRLELNASGGSEVKASVEASGADLALNASGSSEVEIAAHGVENAKINASGTSNVNVGGTAQRGYLQTSGTANIAGQSFTLRDAVVTASGASDVRVNASGALTTKTSGTASVRYVGRPASINNANGSVRPL